MLLFREPPKIDDSKKGTPPPRTWPNPIPPSRYFIKEDEVIASVSAEWKPWWTDVSVNYHKTQIVRHIGIHEIAHALFLELNNGWSFEFCLRYCEENLIETIQGVSISPSASKLTTRGRAFVDEMIAGAVGIAIAGEDGYHFLGDLERIRRLFPGMIDRRWQGNGPDHLVAKLGTATDGYVAQYIFLEAKGVADSIPKKTPRNFVKFKTQSLNAKLLFGCVYKPVLSYVYLPFSEPLVAQWFNAPPEDLEDIYPESKLKQALLLLCCASDQFQRIRKKSKLTRREFNEYWTYAGRSEVYIYLVSKDGYSAISIIRDSIRLFRSIKRLINGLAFQLKSYSLDENEFELFENVERLRKLSVNNYNDLNDIQLIGSNKFRTISRDSTGFSFLRRVVD